MPANNQTRDSIQVVVDFGLTAVMCLITLALAVKAGAQEAVPGAAMGLTYLAFVVAYLVSVHMAVPRLIAMYHKKLFHQYGPRVFLAVHGIALVSCGVLYTLTYISVRVVSQGV